MWRTDQKTCARLDFPRRLMKSVEQVIVGGEADDSEIVINREKCRHHHECWPTKSWTNQLNFRGDEKKWKSVSENVNESIEFYGNWKNVEKWVRKYERINWILGEMKKMEKCVGKCERINWILWELEKRRKMGQKMWMNQLNFYGGWKNMEKCVGKCERINWILWELEKRRKMGQKMFLFKIISRLTVNVAVITCFAGTLELTDFIFSLKKIYK